MTVLGRRGCHLAITATYRCFHVAFIRATFTPDKTDLTRVENGKSESSRFVRDDDTMIAG